jgi:hypothetical protein
MLARFPFLFLLLASTSLAQSVRLSEFMAQNVQSVPDIVDFEDYPDWIELENTTNASVSLDGYFLSDDPAKPLKWMIPNGATIPANGFIRIWADGHNAAPGQSYPRGYWPWRNFTTEAYHTSFSLSPLGGSLVLTRAASANATSFNPVDSVSYPQQIPDVSLGRDPANPDQWVQFAHPTPGAANAGALVNDLRLKGPGVTVSLNGGFYSSSQQVALTSAAGEIRYTLDGSDGPSQFYLSHIPATTPAGWTGEIALEGK